MTLEAAFHGALAPSINELKAEIKALRKEVAELKGVEPVSEYLRVEDLCERFRTSKTTLKRWRERPVDPFPEPVFETRPHRWRAEDVAKWEKRQ